MSDRCHVCNCAVAGPNGPGKLEGYYHTFIVRDYETYFHPWCLMLFVTGRLESERKLEERAMGSTFQIGKDGVICETRRDLPSIESKDGLVSFQWGIFETTLTQEQAAALAETILKHHTGKANTT